MSFCLALSSLNGGCALPTLEETGQPAKCIDTSYCRFCPVVRHCLTQFVVWPRGLPQGCYHIQVASERGLHTELMLFQAQHEKQGQHLYLASPPQKTMTLNPLVAQSLGMPQRGYCFKMVSWLCSCGLLVDLSPLCSLFLMLLCASSLHESLQRPQEEKLPFC